MANITSIIKKMKNKSEISFSDLCKVCDQYFGEASQSGTSHRVYKTSWLGDPRVNIQNSKGKAKKYQVSNDREGIAIVCAGCGRERYFLPHRRV